MTSSDNENDRKRPSKVLSALDTSDHVSIRAAIDRILQRPDLVGAQVKPKDAHKDRALFGATRITDEYRANHKDSPFDTGHLQRPENNNMDEWMTARTFSDSEYTNSRVSFSTQGPLWTQSNRFSPLPRSSPFTTDSSIMDVDRDVILEFESSPRLPSSPIAEWSDNQSTMFGHHLPETQHMHPSKDSAHGSDLEHFQHLSRLSTDSNEFSGSKIHSSPGSSPSFFPPSPTFLGLDVPDSPDQVHCVHETQPVKNTSDITAMSGLPLDFLADPDPWTTVGRILQLEHLQATSSITSSNERPIDFTRGREGVGHPSQIEENDSDNISTGTISDTSPNEAAMELNQHSGDNHSPPRTASPVASVRKSLQNALAYDPNTFGGGVALPPLLRSWPPYSEKHAPTERDGGRMMGANELERRTSEASLGEGPDIVYDGPCLFGDSDPED
ncbi:hypothetical protein EDC04DRAFT_2655553, partial [Pisolithus marmoratus]